MSQSGIFGLFSVFLSCVAGRRRAAVFCVAVLGAGAAAAEPLWFDGWRRPTAQAWQAVEILATAADDGLDARDYDAEGLRRAVADAADGWAWAEEDVAQLDIALTAAMRRYLTDLRFGRVDPRQVHANFVAPAADGFDPLAYLYAAVIERRLPDAVRDAAPVLPLYANVREALRRYRSLARNPSGIAPWLATLPRPPQRKLEPGQAYAGMPVLVQRLVALGDLPEGTPAPLYYEGAVVEGVKAFQRRHGLAEDGVVGKATLEQLDVSPAARVRQIELTLERLRWTPLLQGPRVIVVNVPEFVLRAYEARDGRVEVKAAMKVIVGSALDTRTPLFDEDMRFIEFSPYWNVPPSIARAETIPKLRENAAYLDEQGFEFVAGDGQVITTFAPEYLDAVLRGELRIRQRPGPANALGDIKFIFPNNANIFLHHTSTPRLFGKDRRDFSHGCVRVEEPVALARFVLQDEPDWSEERIRAAMTQGVSKTLRLREPLPVVIAYSTVLVKSDGLVYFFRDIYGHDKLLDAALRQPARSAQPSLAQHEGRATRY
ncbi:L,D-transpeptidase family protein [Azoarcus sp. PA01]|nr:L,D-transpeptidase family protein [Azoarcus sp. PA01]